MSWLITYRYPFIGDIAQLQGDRCDDLKTVLQRMVDRKRAEDENEPLQKFEEASIASPDSEGDPVMVFTRQQIEELAEWAMEFIIKEGIDR